MLALANFRHVFHFCMGVNKNYVDFSFESHDHKCTKSFCLNFDRAKRLFLMLNPKFFNVCLLDSEDNTEFFKLIPLAKG
jgi:hypothetical protein